MKPRPEDNEFNTPEEMLVRATFLLCVAGFTTGILFMLAGAARHELRLVGIGALLLMLAAVARVWLRKQGRFAPSDAAWQEFADAAPAADHAKIDELVQLLRKWDRLERQRGSPGFDPWALQSLRHEIRAMIETDPALERLFHDSRRSV